MSTGCPKREYKKCSNVLPGDAAWEQVDVSRQDVLVCTCKAKALALYLFLLKHATIENVPGQGMTAVFSCRCLRNLAGAECGSYDFITRTISILGALELVQHYHHTPSGTQLHLPLGPYQALTSLASLNVLMNQRRFKLCQLAASTRKRYIYHYGDPGHTANLSTLQQLKDKCQQLLQGQLTRETVQLLTVQINSLASYFQDPADKDYPGHPEQHNYADQLASNPCYPAQVTRQDNLHPMKGDSEWTITTDTGDLLRTKGDLPVQVLTQKGDLLTPEGDPKVHKGRPEQDQDVDKGRPELTKGDLQNPWNTEKGDPTTLLEHKHGYSEVIKETRVTPVSIIDDNILILSKNNYLSNDNIIDKETAQTLKNSTSERKSQIEQIRKEAEALAFFVEQTPRNLPSFISKLSNNPRATRAAVIDLLVHTHQPDYRGKPRVPGAWVNRAYQRYNCVDPIVSDKILRWLDSPATWQEIDHTLRLEAEERSQSPTPASSNDTTHIPQDNVPTSRASCKSTALTAVPLDPHKKWLDEAEAYTLARQIVQDGEAHGYTIMSEVMQKYAGWLVNIHWENYEQEIISLAHWRSEFTELHNMLQARQRIPA